MSYNLSDVQINPANTYEEDKDNQIPVKSPAFANPFQPSVDLYNQANQNLKTLGRAGLTGLEIVGTGVEAVDKSISIGNALGILTGLPQEHLPQNRLTKTSYHDIRSAGVEKIRELNPTAGLVADVLAPNAIDLLFGAGKIAKGLKGAVKYGPEVLRIFDKTNTNVWRKLGILPEPKLATAGTNLTINSSDISKLKDFSKLQIKGTDLATDTVKANTGRRAASAVVDGTRQPKTNALNRYDEFKQKGYEIPEPLRNQAEAIRNPDYTTKLKGIKQWDNKDAYIKAAQKHYDDTGISTDIRTKIGVYVDDNGEVYQMMSRKKGDKLSFRSWSEKANTDLNRKLSLFQQQGANIPAYDSAENVSILMKRMNFKGTAKEFKAKYAIHHRRSIVAYEPFFHGLNGKEAAELRKLLEVDGIKLGDHIDNLVAIPKRMHTVDKQSIHTLMRHNAIEGRSKGWDGIVGTYDAQESLRKRFANASVQGRHKAIKIYQEYVQQPTDDMLQKILDALD